MKAMKHQKEYKLKLKNLVTSMTPSGAKSVDLAEFYLIQGNPLKRRSRSTVSIIARIDVGVPIAWRDARLESSTGYAVGIVLCQYSLSTTSSSRPRGR